MKAADVRNRIQEVRRVRFGDVQAHPGNFRRHPANQRRALEGVVGEVGFASVPLAYHSQRNGGGLTWLDGHLRSEAFPDYEGDVAVLDVDDSEAALLLATLDPLAALATHDAEALDALLRDVQTGDAAVQELLADVAAQAGLYAEAVTTDTEPEIDRAEELRQKWGVSAGNCWQLGEHRLLCGDCTDKAVVERLLQGEKPALMVTDPPYGVNYDPNWRNEAAEAGFLSFAERRTGTVTNDDRVDWSDAYNLFPGDVAYTWSPPGDHVILTGLALQKAGFQIRNQIVWVKPHFPISRGHYTYQHEPCWYGVRKGKQAHWIGNTNASTTWRIALDANVEGGHSTQKPLACMATPIANHEGDVYEPFSGSGTTIIACENLKRRCYAIEISPAYVAVALERWAVHTNRTPVRVP